MLSSDDTPPSRPRSRLFPVVCSILVMAGLILILIEVGKWTRERVSHLDRYTISFADIECRRPPAQDEFLSEVQYLGNLPDQLHLLDADLPERLADAFARHPWVEKVEEVKIVPPKQIHVRLVYRTPVLQVIVIPASRGTPAYARQRPEETSRKHALAASQLASYQVDGHGILLRGSVEADNLPHFDARTAPAGPAGTPWGDAAVEAAARTAGFLRPYQDQLQVQIIEGGTDDLILKGRFAGRILWGRPPGAELPGEASAAQKVQRLLDFRSLHGELGSQEKPCEHDVRPKEQALHRGCP